MEYKIAIIEMLDKISDIAFLKMIFKVLNQHIKKRGL